MTYFVHFRVDLDAIPDGAEEIRRTMEQIADVLNTVPASSPFWISMRDSLLQIDVKGWRVVYRIDRGPHEIVVVEIAPIRG